MSMQLIVTFKDFLMGLPEGLNFQLLIDGKILSSGVVSKTNATLTFIFKPFDKSTLNIYDLADKPLASVPTKESYSIVLNVLNKQGVFSKTVGKATLKAGKRLTVVAVSPWVKVPLEGGADLSSSFLEVEYNIKNETNKVQTVKVKILDIPKKILTTALKYRGRTDWAGLKAKKSASHPKFGTVTFPEKTNKCNLFVNDVLTEAGISVAWIEHGKSIYIPWMQNLSPPLAGEWANSSKLTSTWSVNSTPLPGDVAAYAMNYSDASGHVGFVVADGVCVSAGWDKIEVNDAGFRHKNKTARADEHDFTVFRRYKPLEIK